MELTPITIQDIALGSYAAWDLWNCCKYTNKCYVFVVCPVIR